MPKPIAGSSGTPSARLRLADRLPTAESSTAPTVNTSPSAPRSPLVGRAISGQNIRATPARPSRPPTTKRPPIAAPNSSAAPSPVSSGDAE